MSDFLAIVTLLAVLVSNLLLVKRIRQLEAEQKLSRNVTLSCLEHIRRSSSKNRFDM